MNPRTPAAATRRSPAVHSRPAGRARFAVAALLLLALPSVVRCGVGDDVSPPVAAAAEPAAAPAGSPDAAESEVSRAQATVEGDAELPVAPAPEADLTHAFAFELTVSVLDEYGLPVPDAIVFAAPPLCGFARWPEHTDARGRVRLTFRGRARLLPVRVAVIAWGVLQPVRLVRVEADVAARLALVAQGARQSPEVVAGVQARSDTEVRRAAREVQRRWRGRLQRRDELDVLCGRTQLLFQALTCVECHDRSAVRAYETFARCGLMHAGLHPDASFCDLTIAGAAEVATARDAPAGREASRPKPAAEPSTTAVQGRVFESDGSPAVEVPVAWLDRDGSLLHVTKTNTRGQYVLEPVAVGGLDLVAGGGSLGSARALVVTVPRVPVDWSCTLAPISVVRGDARGPGGDPLVGWRVEFARSEGDWAAVATTDDQGRFLFTDVPGAGECLLWPRDGDCRLPIVYGRTALVDATPVALALDRAQPTRARLVVHAGPPPGWPSAPIDAQVQQLDTGRVAALESLGHEDAFALEGLPAGPYRVELGAPGFGWVETGVVTIDGRGLWDLGRFNLAAPGRVRFRVPPGTASPLAGEHAFCRRTAAADVRVEARREDTGDFLLAAGEHVLVWRDPDGLRAVAFQVVAGGRTEVQLAAR